MVATAQAKDAAEPVRQLRPERHVTGAQRAGADEEAAQRFSHPANAEM
jgi:hypothetical protein